MIIEQLFTSHGHNYYGHHGQPPDDFPLLAAESIECVTGRGIRGDRFFDYRDDYKGQITFFSSEVFALLTNEFGLTTKSPGVLRRNVIVSGVDLMKLIGLEFELQGVQFRGSAHCKPCYWMDTAFAPGAEKFLAGRGGLRARILSDGRISRGDARFKLLQSAAKIA
ncbi:MAG: molybdenum cofactor biosysynthesis protein [Chthoniobacterales bacterium]|nr:molybdenum cofactor biosysynthesis protein [Chthoniobacterales bacterium]